LALAALTGMTYSTLIDTTTLAAHGDDPLWCIVDCRFDLNEPGRGEAAYSAGHIPGAIYAHLDRDLSSPITPDSGRHPLPDALALTSWLGRHGIDRATQVVAYDDSGGTMAVRLWWLLRWLGHTRVAVLDGGWQAWEAARLAVDTTLPVRRRTCFDGRPDADMVVSTEALAETLAKAPGALMLLDARTPERFRGESEPIDPVAGHVPSAINLPLQRNLDGNGFFLSARQLHEIYAPVIQEHPITQVVAMCGSGVTACHNLLAMEIAGLGLGRLYAGSWSEWIRDPQRPVVTGD
jgi:thiosulfate/3-mercaptopyruvate sulfurtransferase